jgi:hypothetical protein
MKKIKIFGHPWHIGHQHSLITALPEYNFYYILDRFRPWKTENRPIPKNLYFVEHYEPGTYDLAILHIDQQCLHDNKKGMPYNILDKQIEDIPKIVINHGTPHFLDKDQKDLSDEMREKIGNNLMIINSEEARREWGFGRTIIHGINSNEFKPTRKKENRIITTLSPSYDITKDGWAQYYNREFFAKVKEKINIVHVGHDIKFENFDNYRKYLAESLVYFNPTLHSPMPRGRTEAMLSGCCIVSTPYHDWGKYIIDGKNGFLISGQDVGEAVKILEWCRRNPSKTQKIGMEGRRTAMQFFSVERYRKDWVNLIEEVLRGGIITSEVKELRKQIEDIVYLIPGAEISSHWQGVLNNILENFSKKITKL